MQPRALVIRSIAMLTATLCPLQAQCCKGAYDVTGRSPDGRYRVEATSQNGTGLDVHGPYHFRFRFLERQPGGQYEELNTFEVKWNTTAHFGMELFVSPVGNGFAVELPNDYLSFYTRAGRKIFESGPCPLEPTRDGASVILCRPVPLRRDGTTHVEGSRLFLPLGARVTDQLDDQVMSLLHLDEKRVAAGARDVAEHVRELDSADPEVRQAARRGLLYHAFLSIRPLREALAKTDDPVLRKRLAEVLWELRMWEDRAGEDAWHDLPLLLALSSYPDELIRQRAAFRVVSMLSPSLRKPYESHGRLDEALLPEALRWVRENQERLRWDSTTGEFVLRKKDSSGR